MSEPPSQPTPDLTPLDALTAMTERRSTRRYRKAPLPRELVERILAAARTAPSAYNEQPWQFVVVTEAEGRRRIADLTDYGKFIAEAPVCVAVFIQEGKYSLEAGSAVTQNILLAAAALGVQSCWVAGDKKAYAAAVRDALGVPADHGLMSLVSLGYALRSAKPTPKRALKSMLHWERF